MSGTRIFMANKTDIILGPILGYEWDESNLQSYYTVVARLKAGESPRWNVGGRDVAMTDISGRLHDGSHVWRGEIALQPFTAAKPENVAYRISSKGRNLKSVTGASRWKFQLPGKPTGREQPRIAFCSCNGFSDPKQARDLVPLAMWNRLAAVHRENPYALLLMGGDQLYCDDLARQPGTIMQLWNWLAPESRNRINPSPREMLQSYLDHYLMTWSGLKHGDEIKPHTSMVEMMASVPSVMVWDDHDIFDGWGSYQAASKKMPYHKKAFDAARRAFELYQVRGSEQNHSLLDRRAAGPRHFSQGLRFGPYSILVMDHRSNRTPDQIMDGPQWKQILHWLGTAKAAGEDLLVVSPVPVIYRRFYDWISELPGEHGGEDDLRDHWCHRQHEGERDKLIYHLFSSLRDAAGGDGFQRITILSGDVHVGCMGYLERAQPSARITQVISSAIMHPPPSCAQWAGLRAISSDDPFTIKSQSITVRMTRPVGSKDRYIRRRNFVWLQQGTDGKLWVNWELEQQDATDAARVEAGLPPSV